jgi:hypothetical protein
MNYITASAQDFYKQRCDFIHGIIFGSAVCLSQFNLKYGIPASILIFIIINRDKFNLKINYSIKLILLLKIFVITFIWLLFSNKGKYNYIQIISPDILLLLLLYFSNLDQKFVKGMAYPLFLLFISDFFYNIYSLFINSGLAGTMRAGDVIPRLTGILNSPIASVNISFLFFVYALYFRKYLLSILSFLAAMMTGALKAPLLFVAYFIGLFVLKLDLKKIYIFIFSLIFILSIYTLVSFHSNLDHHNWCLRECLKCMSIDLNGSAMRMVAWENTIQNIILNPIHGFNQFNQEPYFGSSSTEGLINRGIAESTYLQYMVDWGALVGILQLTMLMLIFLKKRNQLIEGHVGPRLRYEQIVTTALALAFILDSFFSSFFSSFIVVIYAGILVINLPVILDKKSNHRVI